MFPLIQNIHAAIIFANITSLMCKDVTFMHVNGPSTVVRPSGKFAHVHLFAYVFAFTCTILHTFLHVGLSMHLNAK